MPLKKWSSNVTIYLLCVFLLLNCGGKPPAANNAPLSNKLEPRTTGTQGGKLTYRLTTAPKTFNYLLAEDEASIMAAFFPLTSRLIDFDHENLKYAGALAESWTMQPDGKTLDVKLRPGLQFSDGHSLTTDDVIFTLAAIYDKRSQAAAWRDAMLVNDKEIATKKISDTEMQLLFPEPVASPENYLVNIGVLPAHVLGADQKAGKLAEAMKINAEASSIVSSGPFVLEAANPGERIDYARNAHYWKKDAKGTQLPYLDKMSIEIIPDANNTLVRLNQGTLDIADRIRTGDYTSLSKGEGPTRGFDVGAGLGIDHIWFNLNTADPSGKLLGNEKKLVWFADKRFRTAVASAIDRESIANVTLQGLATPLHGFISPANKLWLDPSLPKISYSLSDAEKMLTEAGFRKGGTPEAPVLTDAQGNAVEFTLIVPAENEARKLEAAVVQEDLAKLGIKMEVAPVETAQLQKRANETYDYDAILFGLSQTDLEPSSYSNFLLSSAATHQWQPKQKTPATEWEGRIDKLFAEQSAERDEAKRKAAFFEIEQIMRREMPTIPIVARHVVAAANARIGNYHPSPIMPYSLWNVDELFIKK